MRLYSGFYIRPAVTLAPALLGKILCRRLESGEIIRRAITETEAYCGEKDTACHAHRGMTPRTSTMYKKGGTAYVYLCYGIHHLFNVIAAEEGEPQGVLIRGVENTAGPGRVSKLMQINMSLNGIDLASSELLWLEDGGGEKEREPDYTVTPRIGINYASPADRDALLRFILKKKI